ncbi:MAG: S6e family ribosomal protein, partial [Candidatus Bathyarchaeota archaeon]
RKGDRKRKTVRGNVITDSIVQVNMRVVEKPKGKKAAKPETETAPAEETA